MHRNIKILLTSSILLHSGINLLAPIYAIFISRIGGTLFDAGASIGVYAFLRGILYFVLGRLKEHRVSRRAMISAGYFIFFVGYCAYLVASSPIHVFFIQGLLALGEVVINPSWSAVIATSLEGGKERKIYSSFYGWRSFFEGAFAALGGLFAMKLGFSAVFLVMAAFALAASLISLAIEERGS
ncbi:MAG: MFS transporter [Candidatus Methanosuratincola sp.]